MLNSDNSIIMEFSFVLIFSIALIFFVAAIIHGSIGLGFPIVSTPLLALIVDYQTAILLTIIPTLLVNLGSIRSEGSFVQVVRHYYPLAAFTLLGSAFGTLLLIIFESELFKIILALAIFIYLQSDRIKLNLSWVADYPNVSRLSFGLAAGLLGGLTNVMAPILIIYALESRFPRSEIIRATNLCFLTGKLSQFILFAAHGKFTVSIVSTSVMLLLVTALALWMGVALRKKIREEVYKRILRGFLFLLALLLIIRVMADYIN